MDRIMKLISLNTEKEKVSPKLKTTEEKEQVTQVSPTPSQK